MRFYTPPELTDPFVQESLIIPHGEEKSIVELTSQIDTLSQRWLAENPGWSFFRTALVACADGSQSPAYDVKILLRRPRTAEELAVQTSDRQAWVARHEMEYQRRSQTQRAILEEVLASLDRHEN